VQVSAAKFFVNAAHDSNIREWIKTRRETAVKTLAVASDPLNVYRAQGQLQLLDEVETLIEAAKNLRNRVS
jgi:hypothetical protein